MRDKNLPFVVVFAGALDAAVMGGGGPCGVVAGGGGGFATLPGGLGGGLLVRPPPSSLFLELELPPLEELLEVLLLLERSRDRPPSRSREDELWLLDGPVKITCTFKVIFVILYSNITTVLYNFALPSK